MCTDSREDMADKITNFVEKEVLVKKLKRSFERYREIVLLLNEVLLWKKKYYPWYIFGAVSVIFLQFNYYEPSVLTTVSLLGLIWTIFDFMAPKICSTVWNQADWNAAKERDLEHVSKATADVLFSCKQALSLVRDFKKTRPTIYYPVTICILSTLVWIGNSFSNLFIAYISVLQLLLLPGMMENGILSRYYHGCLGGLYDLLHSFNIATDNASALSKSKTN